MLTLEKTYGVRGSDSKTCIKIQELIYSMQQQMPIGKVVIDTEKMTFYKLGFKLAIVRFASNGLVCDEKGKIKYVGLDPDCQIKDMYLYQRLLDMFGLIDYSAIKR